MHRNKTSSSGYARLAQAEEEEEDEDVSYHDDPNHEPSLGARTISGGGPGYAPIQPGRRPLMQEYKSTYSTPSQKRRRRERSNSAVDVKAINARLERWADEIASKFKLKKIKGKSQEEEKLEIYHSVFQPPEGIRPVSGETLAARFSRQPDDHMTKLQFDDTVESVRVAIELGVHPKLITQGSSGSYFARNSDGKTVGVFKPKDEEPYATKNPKWTKWIHRNLFPFAFGRSFLIPNLSYVSEAAAYVLDTRLQTSIVPYTDVVYLSSISFNNDYWDRRAYWRKRKPLPPKAGSLQIFLKGYKDATLFLQEHPWPDQQTSSSTVPATTQNKRKKGWTDYCRPSNDYSDDEDEGISDPAGPEQRRRKRFWSEALQLSFREELEKLVILDYIMRNTDRGLDNWMIRIDEETQTAKIVAEPTASPPNDSVPRGQPTERDLASGSTFGISTPVSKTVRLGAIDNSLSFPWKHPDAWRSYPFGWLFLPVSLIGQPFTEKTRQHFLPLLTSKQWWSETQIALRRCFEQDSDFKERMFARQMAVLKGQAWNVVETLKEAQHGPLELTRRTKVCVWDDLVDIPVVMPLREASPDMKQAAANATAHANGARHMSIPSRTNDETDLSTVYSSAPTPRYGPLATDSMSPPDDAPSSKRFNLSRENSVDLTRPDAARHDSGASGANDTDQDRMAYTSQDSPASKSKAAEKLTITLNSARSLSRTAKERPSNPRSRTRASLTAPHSPETSRHADARKRNFSFSARRVSDSGSGAEDDGYGDLGFAAVSERDRGGVHSRKVIVERLETVTTRGPVFTWC